MSEPVSIAKIETRPELAYLLPRAESFWRWSDDGNSIEWRGGRTIAFRQEVEAVLARLAPAGRLPPFGALVLLLAAMRGIDHDPADTVDLILKGYSRIESGGGSGGVGATSAVGRPLIETVVSHRVRQEVREIVDDLAAVENLPTDLRQNLAARCGLAEFVFMFNEQPALSVGASESVLALLRAGVEPDALRKTAGRDGDFSRLAAELESLRPGLARVAAEPVSTFMRTGLDRSVEAAPEIELPAAERARALIRQLQSDPELAGVAKLARDVLAALHVPRSLAAPEEIPVGGVSDIANRGPLDRLLVSELAHDDLTLAVRVAVNEALYLRRESPARHPPFSRAILLDVGIRLWGVPRLFAASVGLALAASADPRAPVLSFRTRGGDVREVDLTSRDGLAALLEALEADPHPARSLRPWLAMIADASSGAAAETFIVTHEAAIADPEFLPALRAADASREWYVATVAGDGTFTLRCIGLAGSRDVCRAALSLEHVAPDPAAAGKPPTAAAAVLLARDPNLPAILFQEPFPLRLPAPINPRLATLSQTLGLIALTHDRRLMRWTGDRTGGAQLTASLPPGQVQGIFADEVRDDVGESVHVVIVRGNQRQVEIVSYDAHGGGLLQQRQFDRDPPQRVFFHRGAIYLGYAHEVRVIDPATMTEQLRRLGPGVRWTGLGPFVRSHLGIQVIAPQGLHLLTPPVPAQPLFLGRRGPWLICSDGAFAPAEEAGEKFAARRNAGNQLLRLLAASDDGDRVLALMLDLNGKQATFYLDLDEHPAPVWRRLCEGMPWAHHFSLLLGKSAWWASGGTNVRGRFDSIIPTGGALALASRQRHHVIETAGDDLVLRHILGRAVPREAGARPFSRAIAPQHARYDLKVAKWDDGSRAFVDSRGLLHLVSSDPKLPQLTLVLTSGWPPLAGWTSDGRCFGWRYFLPTQPTDDARLGATLIREFCRRLR